MKRKTGHNYEAKIQVAFESEEQARDFCSKNTLIGERVALDIEDPDVLELFEAEDTLTCEINYPEAIDPRVQEEIDAAKHVGAVIEITFEWVPNG